MSSGSMRSPDSLREVRAWLTGRRARLARLLATWRAGLAGAPTQIREGLVALAPRLARLGRKGAKVAALVLLISTVLAGGAFAASTLYAQYGGPKAVTNALAWADRTPAFSRSACQACHQRDAGIQTAGLHATVTCEACHGPQGTHPGSGGKAIVPLAATPTSALCITCHTQVAGRPASLPQVDPTAHYSGGLCLRCHDPHTIVAVAPPEVTHPLTDLPACTTCHAPDGLKKVPAGHEMVSDEVCLSCHAARKPNPSGRAGDD